MARRWLYKLACVHSRVVTPTRPGSIFAVGGAGRHGDRGPERSHRRPHTDRDNLSATIFHRYPWIHLYYVLLKNYLQTVVGKLISFLHLRSILKYDVILCCQILCFCQNLHFFVKNFCFHIKFYITYQKEFIKYSKLFRNLQKL